MSEIVERVARVLFLWQHGHDRWDEAEPEEREDACEAARAAIEAMREPTKSMIKAGDNSYENALADPESPNAALYVWEDMIDEALK